MRIAVISNTAWYLFNFRLNLMQALLKDGHTVVAVSNKDSYAEKIRAAGIEFEEVKISGSGTNPLVELRSVIDIWNLLRRKDIDLVLSYTPKGNLYSAMASVGLSKSFIPNVSGLGRAFVCRSLVTIATRVLYRLTFRRAHRVFFQNMDDMAVFFCSGFVRPQQAERLPGSGVDLKRFQPMPLQVRTTDVPVFLFVARMLWDKGVGEYVEAARKVKTLYPCARFQLLGFLDTDNPSAVSREQMDEWVAEGVVEYLGQTDDIRPFFISADCVVLPSKYREGVPRTLLEAAATARPLITTDAPGCRDTVIDGVTGFLCRSADAIDLERKLLRFIEMTREERQTMGERGRTFIAENFDEKIVLHRYLDVISSLESTQKSKYENKGALTYTE